MVARQAFTAARRLAYHRNLLKPSFNLQHVTSGSTIPFTRMASGVPKTMAGVVINKTGGTEVLEYKTDISTPVPKENEVLIKNEFMGVNFIDTYFRSGLYKAPGFPYILGREGAGSVVSAPPSSSLKPGDKVVYMSERAYSDYISIPGGSVFKIPNGISTETAAASLLQALTAWTLVTVAHPVKAGDYILVTAAAGGTGQWLVRMGKSLGAIVIATCSTSKVPLVKELGADEVIDYSGPGGMEFSKAVIAKTPNGEGVAAVFDGVGKTTFDECLASIKTLGSMISFGNASGAVDPLVISRLSAKNVRLMRPTLFNFLTTQEERDTYVNAIWKFLLDGGHDAPVHNVYDLKDVAKAHQDLEGRRTTGKLLLKP